MDFYSATLGLALAAATAALGLAWLRGVGRAARYARAVALVLVSLSGLNHVMTGHAPGSSSELGPAAFLGEHPALLIAAGAAIASWFVQRMGRPA